MQSEAECTIHITGFPLNATDREMETFCRFMPGFVGARCQLAKGVPQVFVRFDTPMNAIQAQLAIEGQPFDLEDQGAYFLSAVMAKSDLTNPEPRKMFRHGHGAGPKTVYGFVNPRLGLEEPSSGKRGGKGKGMNAYGDEADWGRQGKRMRYEEPCADICDTICVRGFEAAGYDQASLGQFFGLCAKGYVAMRPGKTSDVVFVKFANEGMANAAVTIASRQGLNAEVAKKSLDVERLKGAKGGKGGKGEDVDAWGNAGNWAAPQSQWGNGEAAGDLNFKGGKGGSIALSQIPRDGDGVGDTVVITSAPQKGLDDQAAVALFSSIPGYTGLRYNPKGFVFAKFACHDAAVAALSLVSDYAPQIAKKSLGLDQATHVAQLM